MYAYMQSKHGSWCAIAYDDPMRQAVKKKLGFFPGNEDKRDASFGQFKDAKGEWGPGRKNGIPTLALVTAEGDCISAAENIHFYSEETNVRPRPASSGGAAAGDGGLTERRVCGAGRVDRQGEDGQHSLLLAGRSLEQLQPRGAPGVPLARGGAGRRDGRGHALPTHRGLTTPRSGRGGR